MSILHPEFCELVERLAREPADEAALELLSKYGEPVDGIPVDDQLDRETFETVEMLTRSEDVWSPQRAAVALLTSMEDAR